MEMSTNTSKRRCRMLLDSGKQCSQQALNTPDIDICPEHAAAVMVAVRKATTNRGMMRVLAEVVGD